MRRQASLRWAACVAAGIACVASGEATAVAQEEGVFLDPDSPAGKEYALPLEAARRDAAGGGTASNGSDAAPLFGAGISRRGGPVTRDGSEARSHSRPDGRQADGSNSGRQADGSSSDASAARDSSSAAAVIADGGTGISAGLLTALIGLGVLLLGGVVGLSVRALRATEQPH